MLTLSRTRQAYLRVVFLVAVCSAAVAVLLNIPVAVAYFVTGVLGVLTSFFFFCAPFTVRGGLSPSWVRTSFVVVAFGRVNLVSVGTYPVPVSAADILQHERSPQVNPADSWWAHTWHLPIAVSFWRVGRLVP